MPMLKTEQKSGTTWDFHFKQGYRARHSLRESWRLVGFSQEARLPSHKPGVVSLNEGVRSGLETPNSYQLSGRLWGELLTPQTPPHLKHRWRRLVKEEGASRSSARTRCVVSASQPHYSRHCTPNFSTEITLPACHGPRGKSCGHLMN